MKSWKWEYLKELVDSMSVNEKRYFKLMVNDTSSKNYFKIFDAISKQASDKEIKESLANSKINISYEKSYLIKLILRSQRNFHEEDSLENSFHQALIDIEILLNKHLIAFSYDFIEYHLDIAKKYELYSVQLQLLKKKRKCIMRMGDIQKQFDFIEEESFLEEDCLEKMKNIAIYKTLQQKAVVIISQRGNSLKEKDFEYLRSIGDHPMMKDIKLAHSIYAKLHFYEIKIWCNYYEEKYEIAYNYSKEMIKTIEDSAFIFNAFPQMYLAVYANHYSRAYKLDKYDELDAILEKIDRLANSKNNIVSKSIKYEAFSYSSERKLIFSANHNQFYKCIEQFVSNKKVFSIAINNFKPSYLILQYYFAAYSYFFIQDYEKSIKCIKEILDNFGEEIRFDFIIYTKILNLMIQYELGNFTIITYLLKSLEKQISKHKMNNGFLSITTSFMKKIIKNSHQIKFSKDIFNQYKIQIDELNKSPNEEIFISTLGILKWIEDNLKKE